MKTKVKTITLIISVILIAVSLAIAVTAITYAVWVRQVNATEELDMPVDEYNPSLKYIIFHGINNSGALVDSSPTAYAVVGYDGLVAELIIPPTYNGRPVTKICADPDNIDKRLAENPIITSIRIPTSVTSIATGACQSMPILEKVIFEVNSEGVTPAISVGDFAFAHCPYLTTFNQDNRSITGNRDLYLLGTAVPQA